MRGSHAVLGRRDVKTVAVLNVWRSFKSREDSLAAYNQVTELDFDFRPRRQVNIGPRAKLDQADAVASCDLITQLGKGDNAPGDDAGNQPNREFASFRIAGFKAEQHVFIVHRRLGAER